MNKTSMTVTGMVVWCVMMAVCLNMLGAAPARAQGGVDWTVTIRNPTQWKAQIFVNSPLANIPDVLIDPGASTTVHLGAKCPNGLAGYLQRRKPPYDWESVAMQNTDMNGTWYDSGGWGAAACWNHKMRICSMPGKEGKFENKAYSFCKD